MLIFRKGRGDISRKYKKYLILLAVLSVFLISCSEEKKANNTKKVDIYQTVQNAFITDDGYWDKFSMHMSEEVFNRINIYSVYELNGRELKKPLAIDFNLLENSQEEKEENIIYVNMTYSVDISDADGKSIGGSKDIHKRFTVELREDEWYISEEYEEL